MGVGLALVIILQAGTGLLLTIGERLNTHRHPHADAVSSDMKQDDHDHGVSGTSAEQYDLMGVIHHGGGAMGLVYRLIVGFGIIGMAFTGSSIFLKSRARARKG